MRSRLHFGVILPGLASLMLWVWSCTELGEEPGPHPAGWAEPASGEILHGLKVSKAGLDGCQSCHGEDLDGGTSGVACGEADCHTGSRSIPHPLIGEHISPSSENFHGKFLREINWDLSYCQTCHGADFSGGVVEMGCSGCHAAPPEMTCDNCHAYKDDALFENVAGDTSTDTLTVGVHTSHYTGTHNLTSNVTCASCHVVPDSVMAATHLDTRAHAEVTFGALGNIAAVGDSTSWDRTTGTCANIYCHGDFAYERPDSAGIFITGNNPTMNWKAPVEGNLCGTCHNLPPAGHKNIDDISPLCSDCHSAVVGPGSNSTIIGLDRHINGLKN